jgi:aspartyl-tRNA(Asn)/glutamyl-tRNA(Gln) amidotransferase subunit A
MTPEPCGWSASRLAAAVGARELSARESALLHLRRARAVEPAVAAFLDLDDDDVLRQADAVDARLAQGEALPLAGVPVAVKDNLCVAGRPATAGSRMLEGWRAPYDATAVERLRAAGAIAFGKTNCDEFAMGSSTEHSAFGPTRNPWDVTRVPGGSSGGSAVAVATRAVPLALGSDTGGSVRQPASLCGVVGLKPTYGRVSRWGLIAFASSLDHVGVLARDPSDAALVLSVIAGADGRDATCAVRDPAEVLGPGAPGAFRFGVPAHALAEGVADGVRERFEAALQALREAGGTRVDVELPHADAGVATYVVIATAEASSNLARYDSVRYGRRVEGDTVASMIARSRSAGFGPEVKRRILLGTHVLSAGWAERYYRHAASVRGLIAAGLDTALGRCDVIVTPTSPVEAFPLGERADDPLAMALADTFTVPANLAGLPGISVPCGLTPGRLPVGVQLVGRRHDEAGVLGVAAALHEALGEDARHAPPI